MQTQFLRGYAWFSMSDIKMKDDYCFPYGLMFQILCTAIFNDQIKFNGEKQHSNISNLSITKLFKEQNILIIGSNENKNEAK